MLERLRIPAKIAAGFLSAWLITTPVTVNALGFGNIKMKSALNQPLVAEIELLSATADDIKELQVKLASREAFLRAGVDRSVLLSRIKFDIVKRGGKYIISLRTQETVREPFLNFLLEMNWKSGRMLREYTVLLDPPDRFQSTRTAKAPAPAPAETFVAPAPEPAPAPALAEPEPAPAPVAAAPEPAPAMPEPAPEAVTPAESPFLDAPAPAPAEEGGLFPQVALDSEPQAPADVSPEPAPEPIAAPEPVPAPEPAPEPEMAAAPEPVPAPEPAPEPATEPALPEPSVVSLPDDAAFQEEDDGLFPQVAIKDYSDAQHEPSDVPEPVEIADGVEPAEPYEPVGELDYGITQKGDNAWKIAEKLKPSEQISVYQVMMALQQSNPSAFVDGNIHRLKPGQVMRIDDASLLTQMSKEQASEQYQVQTSAWEEYLASVGAEVPRQAIVAGEEAAPVEEVGESGELTLATPTGDQESAATGTDTGTASADSALLQEQARKALAEAETERARNAELTGKLEKLEDELKKLENVINVKDSDLAELQRRLEELNQVREAGDQVAQTKPAPVETTPEPTPEPVTEEPVAEQPEPVAAEPSEPAADSATEVAAADSEVAPVEPEAIEPEPIVPDEPTGELSDAVEPSPLDVPAPAEPAPQPAAQQSDGGGIMGTITGIFSGLGGMFAGSMLFVIGGVVGLIVLILIVILLRRRKGVNFQESILNDGAATPGGSSDTVAVDATPSQGSLMGGESSFLSDFAISGVSAIQAEDSEVDPLTEADVFMAYGRYEAAEERLQEAINQDPGRGELRVKLLELYNTTKNKQGFETSAEDFYATLGDGASSDPLWQKVVAMGTEIAPGNPLFSGDGMPAPSAAPAAEMDSPDVDDSQVMDIGLDTGVFDAVDTGTNTGETEAAAEAYTGGGDLDFNLGDDSSAEAPAGGLDLASELDADVNLDTNTGDLSTGSDDTGLDFSLDSDESSAEIAMPASEDLDFNLDTSTSGDESTQTALPVDSGMDFNLDADTSGSTDEATSDELSFDLDSGGDDETATDIEFAMPDTSDSENLDFSSEVDTADASDMSSANLDMNLDAADAMDLDMPAGGDEVGTKLDLARAYIDMGDPDGARSILDEVMDEGNDGQKQEAEQLMAQIG